MRKFIITGNLAKDPKRSPSAKALYMTIAAQNATKDSTEFIPLVAFGRAADVLEEYAVKGQRLEVEGDVSHTKVNEDDYRTSLIIRTFEFSGGRPKGYTGEDAQSEPDPGEEAF